MSLNQSFKGHKSYIVIYKQKLAGYLMLRGFVCYKIERNLKENTNRNVYFFCYSEQLADAIKTFSRIKVDLNEYINNTK